MNKPVGRPSKYTPELADSICERLAGGESLRKICEDEDMPGRQTVLDWLDDDSKVDFRAKYARAREAQADFLVGEMLTIADTPVIGTKTTSKEWGEEITEADMIEHRKLQVATRQWIAAKMAPKKYGDKTSMELTGADGGPVQVSDTERAAKIAAILAAAKVRKDADESDVADLI